MGNKHPFLHYLKWQRYRKVPKFWDTRKLCCNHPKTGNKRFYHGVMHPKDANSIANSEDPDQTAPQSDLGLQYLPRPICPKTYDHYGISNIFTVLYLRGQ